MSEQWSPELDAYFSRLDSASPAVRRWMLRQKEGGGYPRFVYKFKSVTEKEVEERSGPVQEILVGGKFWLSSPDDFNDPFDGQIHIDYSGTASQLKHAVAASFMRAGGLSKTAALMKIQRERSLERIPTLFSSSVKRERSSLGICSFSTNPRDILLWSHYGDSHRGVALQFDVSLDPKFFCQALPVNYSDEYPTLIFRETRNGGSQSFGDKMISAVTQKSNRWGYECERRVVVRNSARTHMSFRKRALSAVILGASISQKTERYVLELVQDRKALGFPTKVFRARLHEDSYRIRLRRGSV